MLRFLILIVLCFFGGLVHANQFIVNTCNADTSKATNNAFSIIYLDLRLHKPRYPVGYVISRPDGSKTVLEFDKDEITGGLSSWLRFSDGTVLIDTNLDGVPDEKRRHLQTGSAIPKNNDQLASCFELYLLVLNRYLGEAKLMYGLPNP